MLKLISKHVLVEPENKEEEKNGVIIPSTVKRHVGRVILADDKCEAVQVGDRVVFRPNSGYEINYHNQKCLVLKEEKHILAVL